MTAGEVMEMLTSNFTAEESLAIIAAKRYIRGALRRSSRVVDVEAGRNGVLVTVETTALDKRPGERIVVRVVNGEVIDDRDEQVEAARSA